MLASLASIEASNTPDTLGVGFCKTRFSCEFFVKLYTVAEHVGGIPLTCSAGNSYHTLRPEQRLQGEGERFLSNEWPQAVLRCYPPIHRY